MTKKKTQNVICDEEMVSKSNNNEEMVSKKICAFWEKVKKPEKDEKSVSKAVFDEEKVAEQQKGRRNSFKKMAGRRIGIKKS